MPIYEFRCLKCNEIFEMLFLGGQDNLETQCPKCHADDFERVLSTSSFQVSGNASGSPGMQSQTRTCSSGSCTTYDIQGHTR